MTTKTAAVLIQVIAKISLYDCLCVSPHTAKRVITAPFWGSVSIPPLAMEATRCRTSIGIWAELAAAMNRSAMAAKAIPIPPDAEPVIPASTLTLTASFTSGLGMCPMASRRTRKPGRAAMTVPYPYADAVFIAADIAPTMALSVPLENSALIFLKANTKIEDAQDKSDFDGPDSQHLWHLLDDR